MNTNFDSQPTRRLIGGLSLGTALFLGGAFVTFGTWGVGAPIGVTMMLLGLIIPFWEVKMANEGRTWTGRLHGESTVMTQSETADFLETLHSKEPQHAGA